MLQLGVPYFVRQRNLGDLRRDMLEIRDQGATYVIHFLTEFDLFFFSETMKQAVAITQEVGLGVWLDPWGLGGLICSKFSHFPLDHPEACQETSEGRPLMRACPNHPRFLEVARGWVETAAKIGPGTTVFWDEPQMYLAPGSNGPIWACRCPVCRDLFRKKTGHEMPQTLTDEVMVFRKESIIGLLDSLSQYAASLGLRNSICLMPLEGEKYAFGDWGEVASLPAMEIFGCDPYWYGHPLPPEEKVRPYTQRTLELAKKNGKTPQIWIQGYRVPAGRESEIGEMTRLVYDMGIREIAIWADKFGCGDNNRSEDPQAVWEEVGRVFRQLRGI